MAITRKIQQIGAEWQAKTMNNETIQTNTRTKTLLELQTEAEVNLLYWRTKPIETGEDAKEVMENVRLWREVVKWLKGKIDEVKL